MTQLFSGSLWLTVCLFWAVLGLGSHASGQTLMLANTQNVANGYLQRLDDPTSSLPPEQALNELGWHPLPGALNAGFTYQTLWLKITVSNQTPDTSQWILNVSNALLDDVTFFQQNPDGSFIEQRAGENLDRAKWPLKYRAAAFVVTLEPAHEHTLLLRLQTKNAMSTTVKLSPEVTFGQTSRQEYLWHGLYFGMYLALIVFHTVFWQMTRADESGWYLIYVSVCFMLEVFSAGLIQQSLNLPVKFSDPILGCLIAISLPLGFYFSQRQLRISQWLGFRQAYLGLCLLSAMLAAYFVLRGDYQLGAPIAQIGAIFTIFIVTAMAIWLMVKGHRPAVVFLLIFGVYYIGVIVGFLRNLGIVPTHVLTDNATAIGTLLHMILMSTRIIYYYRQMQRDKRAAQTKLKDLLCEHNTQLEQQIAQRTQELRAEISRRSLLEDELRYALEKEQSIREEQRDFVAMVSHEFRTPLAIISTTAQQISRHLNAHERNAQRCQNIRNASERLATLVTDYLNNDRLEDVTTIQRSIEYPLAQLVALSSHELPQERLRVRFTTRLKALDCDAGLVKIALRNMLANADRHAPQHCLIEIELKDRPGYLDILVSHEGQAIPEEQANCLFQKYFRGSQAQHAPGTGLGLYITRRIAQIHGGDATLQDRGETGIIRFKLSLAITHEQVFNQTSL